ncbi:MAG: CCA tRNA nucleotidyltransferase [Rhodobacteraceae bacterium]|nr:CCA tRNA nucleotidyltransferase [Paracoccaceae bacterium]
MKVISEKWLSDPATVAVFTMLEDAGFKAYAVGGCVRNSVFGVGVSDIDIATDARPEQVIDLATNAGLKSIPTGIDHGTITVISNTTPFEVTTFRRDIDTDGRHAKVQFSDDILQDAQRRDFTMNALYCNISGQIIDPLNGIDDTVNRRLKFIGDPQKRIQEDYLRILRFFRFYAQYCDPENGIDADGLAACASNLDGLETLSIERITSEIRKLLAVDNPAPALAAMAKSGVLMRILPNANPQFIAPLVALEQAHNIKPDWLRRLVVIGANGAGQALRLSKAEIKYLAKQGQNLPPAETAYRFGADMAINDALVLAATLGTELPPETMEQIALGAAAKFPVVAADLMPRIAAGPKLGAELRRLEDRWIKSGFRLDKSDLL